MTTESQAVVNEISLKELLLMLKRLYHYLLQKWKTIIAFGILGGILGLTYAYFKRPIYTATTTFVLEEGGSSSRLGQFSGLASIVGIDMNGGGGGLFQGDNIIELYKSRNMVQKTLLSEIQDNGKKQLLINKYIEINGLRDKWNDPDLKKINFVLLEGKQFTRMQDSVLGKTVADINKNYLLVSKLDPKLNIITVEVKGEDEFFAKAFNDLIVKNVNDFYVQTKTKKALENLAVLQRQTDSVKNVLNGAIYQTAAVADATPNLNPSRQTLRAPAQRSQFNAEANKAILTQLVQNLELAKLSLRQERPLIQIVDKPVYPLQKDQLGKVKGTIIGGFLFGFLIVMFLALKKYLNDALSSE